MKNDRLVLAQLYEDTAATIAEEHHEFCCHAIEDLAVSAKLREAALTRLAALFKPENIWMSDAWFNNDREHRVMSLLMMAEITENP